MEAEHDSKIAGHFGTYKTIGGLGITSTGLKWMNILLTTFALAMYVNLIKLSSIRSMAY